MKLSRRKWFTKAGLLIPAVGLIRPTLAQTVIINSFRFASGGGGCSTARDTVTGTTTANLSTEGDLYWGVRFTAAATTTICTASLRLWKHGTPTGNLRAGIFSQTGAVPGTVIDWSNTVAASTLAATEADFLFSAGLSAAITASTAYWLVLHDSAGGQFDGNGARWAYIVGGEKIVNSSDGTTWSETSPSNAFKFSLFSE